MKGALKAAAGLVAGLWASLSPLVHALPWADGRSRAFP